MKKIKLIFALFLIVCLSTNAQDQKDCTFESIETVDQRPEYREAEGNLGTYIASKVEFPESGKFRGMYESFLVEITVDCQGKLADVVLSEGEEVLSDAAERMIKTMEDWKPAILDHNPVSTTIEFLLFFKEEESNEFVVSCLELTESQGAKGEYAKTVRFTPPVIEPYDEDDEISENSGSLSIQVVDFREQDTIKQEEPERTIYAIVEQMPSFPGGESLMTQFISKNIKYPESAIREGIQGRVTIRFVVEPTGELSDIEVARGRDTELDNEAIRIINAMPKWTPGKQNGVALPVYYTVPVVFKLP